ncbi:DUF805 domain-containing protein [Flammeovirga sp. MY04]|uniref:DUF805 domain-containing protein n=1 Tax=Flammeovirga sp. MY04 TaxID=1191459 RepID=UPI0008060E0B|nr:DUF805 domain-containing protein [Flammeovirga sp. MY04]ANQ51771.1 DUF805 domain-containing protein [Flammeovirga sp. MY04]
MHYYFKVLQNYATFTGRARRQEYWMFVLINTIISFVCGMICGMLGYPELANLYSLLVLLPAIGVAVRRMHDVSKSGWYILIPIYNLILTIQEGDHGDNEYGADPKSETI